MFTIYRKVFQKNNTKKAPRKQFSKQVEEFQQILFFCCNHSTTSNNNLNFTEKNKAFTETN